MAYHPNKKGKSKAIFWGRSGHELKKNDDYNEESVKTFDSEDKDYNGSNTDSDVERILIIESDHVDTRYLWRVCYNNFRDNRYNKEGGFKFFHFI